MKTAEQIVKVISIAAILLVPLYANAETPEETYTQIHNLRKIDGEFQQAADAALAFLNEHPEKDNVRQKIFYEYAAALFQQEKFVDAKTAFLGLTTEYADTVLDKSAEDFFVDDAQYFAAMLEQTQGEKDIDKAITGYKAVIDNYPNSKWRVNALMTLGDLSRQKEKWSDSLDYYYRVVDEYPENSDLAPSALYWVNRVLADEVDNAKKKLEDPEYRDVVRVDKKAEIKRNIERVKENYPESDKLPGMLQDYIVFLVWRHHSEGNMDELTDVCYYIMDHYPDTKYAEYAKEEFMDALGVSGKEEQQLLAEEMLNESIAEAEANEDKDKVTNLMYYKGKLFLYQRQYAKAREVFESALEDNPETAIGYEIRYNIVQCLNQEDRRAESREILLALAEDYSEDRDKKSLALWTHAMSFRYEKKHEEALEHLKPIAEEYPDLNVGAFAAEEVEYLEKYLRLQAEKEQRSLQETE